jgi:hypothetical protein
MEQLAGFGILQVDTPVLLHDDNKNTEQKV